MRSIDLRVTLFKDEADRERSERAMHFVLHALCCIDFEYIRVNRTPYLYRSGVHYDNEHAGKKEWYDIGEVLRHGKGDCKDLACWLVAEHWTLGLRSRPLIQYRTYPYVSDDGDARAFSLYHVMVQRPDGRIEDPSRALGMGAEEWPFVRDRETMAAAGLF